MTRPVGGREPLPIRHLKICRRGIVRIYGVVPDSNTRQLCCVVLLLVSRVKLAAVSKHLTSFSCPATASHRFSFWHTPPATNWPLSSGAYKFSFSRFYWLTCTLQQYSETAIQSDFFAALCRLPTHYVPAVRNCLFTSILWLNSVADKRGPTTADLSISILT